MFRCPAGTTTNTSICRFELYLGLLRPGHEWGNTVGLSMFSGSSFNERTMLSLGVVDPDIERA